ncbi:MAG: acyl-CoA desaturase [Actinobacteria bacterium]|nr:acyl-CoA desaturase [Actinomycetota bacterium]
MSSTTSPGSLAASSDPYDRPIEPGDKRINRVHSIPFLLAHLLPLAAIFVKVTWTDVILCAGLYLVRMMLITGGYHRYFSHRSYRLSRVPQFILAFAGTTAVQKGPLWWAAHHRAHHRFSDTDRDVHSPQHGFFWSHVGWILSDRFKETNRDAIRDLTRFPELVWVDRYNWIGPWALAAGCFLIGGWGGLFIGFFLSTVLVWHGTFAINSMAHVFGKRRYATTDTSRNSFLLAMLTFGEGWHNNHHHYQASARQGFFWWEWDPTYYALRVLAVARVVKDLKAPSKKMRRAGRIKDGQFDVGMFRKHFNQALSAAAMSVGTLTSAPAQLIAGAGQAVQGARSAVADARTATSEALDARLEAARRSFEELTEATRRAADELGNLSRSYQRNLLLHDDA